MTRSHVPRRANFELPSLRFASESVAGGKIDADRPDRALPPDLEKQEPRRLACQSSSKKCVRVANFAQFDPI